MEAVKVGPATGSTAPLTVFGHLMVPNHHLLLFALKCYYQKVSLLIMSHLREALQNTYLFLLLKEISST